MLKLCLSSTISKLLLAKLLKCLVYVVCYKLYCLPIIFSPSKTMFLMISVLLQYVSDIRQSSGGYLLRENIVRIKCALNIAHYASKYF
jgi:hypothetical protein